MIKIRWRKSSATYVIYSGRKVYESGFNSEDDAGRFLANDVERGKVDIKNVKNPLDILKFLT